MKNYGKACLAPKLKDYQSSLLYAQFYCLSCAKIKDYQSFNFGSGRNHNKLQQQAW